MKSAELQVLSAELQVLSAELKDRPQGTGYQPSPNKKIPPRHLLLLATSQEEQVQKY